MTFVECLVAVLVGWSLGQISAWLVLLRVMRWLDRCMLPPAPNGGAKAGQPQGRSVLSPASPQQPPALVEEQDTEAFHKV